MVFGQTICSDGPDLFIGRIIDGPQGDVSLIHTDGEFPVFDQLRSFIGLTGKLIHDIGVIGHGSQGIIHLLCLIPFPVGIKPYTGLGSQLAFIHLTVTAYRSIIGIGIFAVGKPSIIRIELAVLIGHDDMLFSGSL